MENLGVTSEEDEEELEEMDVKEEDEDDETGYLNTSVVSLTGRYFDPPPEPAGMGGEEAETVMMAVPVASAPGGGRRSRPREEKERTKLRERHRRAITARILGGLRRHGNYNLRVRADINEVIAALAREAGWVVLPDGTTFPASQAGRPTAAAAAAATPATPHSAAPPLRGISPAGTLRSLDHRPTNVSGGRLRGIFNPNPTVDPACSSSFVAGRDASALIGSCMDSGDDGKTSVDPPPRLQERDFCGTPYVPVYVMLPLGVINMKSELVDPDELVRQLHMLKSVNVDGVTVDCWWGIVEAHGPRQYNWSGYKQLFQIVRQLKLKLQVVMSFHKCGGNVGDDVEIPLPNWVTEIGRGNPDIYFTDREGQRNPECLSWGIDKERVLHGRTALEVYFDYMRSFRVEFEEFFQDNIISEIEIGLGPCGELRYPSYPMQHGWRYPGIGQFQCYDRYMMRSLRKAAEEIGAAEDWTMGPKNAGSYNSQPYDTGFFCHWREYDGFYGRFFLHWYTGFLLDHADHVLMLAKLAFGGSHIAAKISGVHWWYNTNSHAAELTAGFYNHCNRDGYAPIASMLKKHETALNFTCVELCTLNQNEDLPEALSDPKGLVWQVLNAAWDAGIQVASENALPCFDRDGYNKILENAKPINNPSGWHLIGFTYLRLCPALFETRNFSEFERFIKRMHGEAVLDLQV